MSLEYHALKAALGVAEHPFLTMFERYCEDMSFNTRVLEWSCKIAPPAIEAARFLHTSLYPAYDKAEHAVSRLFASLFRGAIPNPNSSLFCRLPAIAAAEGEGIALGYAAQGAGAELKLYIATGRIAAVRPIIDEIVPRGGACPEHTARVMIAASIDERMACRSRVYYLWNSTRLQTSSVCTWVRKWCTSQEADLIFGSATTTVSIAFKDGQRDMIYLSTPFKHPEVNRFVVQSLQGYPLALRELDDLRWIGFSKYGEGLPSKEANVYFNCAFINKNIPEAS